MKVKTVEYNRGYYLKQMNGNQRINIKVAYSFKSGQLFEILHIINIDFAKAPCNIPGWWNSLTKSLKKHYAKRSR